MTNRPKLVLVMRHGEKPDDPRDPDLAPAGKARAARLATYIPETFGAPDVIFATSLSKHSARPYETVLPLSKATGAPIDATVADQDYPVLAADLLEEARYAGKQVVVCWHHGNIPSLMCKLGAPGGAYPDPWKPEVFNLILKVEFSGAGAAEVAQVEEGF